MDRALDRLAGYLDTVVRPVSRRMNIFAAGLIVVMVLWIVVDVSGRFFFRSPLKGTLEFEQFMLAIVVFWAAAYCQIEKKHVSINILMSRLSESAQAVIDSFTYIFTLVVTSLITWQTTIYAINVFATKEVTFSANVWKWPSVALIVLGAGLFSLVLVSDLLQSLANVWRRLRYPVLWFLFIAVISTVVIGIPTWLHLGGVHISSLAAGLIGMGLMLTLMALRMPIFSSMAFIGLLGFWYLRGLPATLGIFGTVPYGTAATFLFTVLPFFILMGLLMFHAGVSEELYRTAYAWVGSQPGGLAMATIGGCAGFAAICGDSLATAATMGSISIPEMKKYNYDPALATGAVAAGGTLGILIPPSVGFIVYAMLTEQSVGELFVAGILPGILLASLFMLTIYIRARINPTLGPKGEPTPFIEKVKSLKGTWAMLVLFLFVMGGIYAGVFTATEGGALGSFGALIIALGRRRLKWHSFTQALLETGRNASMILIILVGVFILGYFVSMSEIPLKLSSLIVSFQVSRYIILVMILLLYVILGMLMNIIPMIMLTLPIFYPTILGLGFDPIWFGVIMVVMMEMGQITPPVGVNVYVIAGVAKDVPMGTIFRGILPFWGVEVICITILTVFPQIALVLPSMMRS